MYVSGMIRVNNDIFIQNNDKTFFYPFKNTFIYWQNNFFPNFEESIIRRHLSWCDKEKDTLTLTKLCQRLITVSNIFFFLWITFRSQTSLSYHVCVCTYTCTKREKGKYLINKLNVKEKGWLSLYLFKNLFQEVFYTHTRVRVRVRMRVTCDHGWAWYAHTKSFVIFIFSCEYDMISK